MPLNVLIVDDLTRKQEKVKNVIEAAIGDANAIVTTASNAASALKALERSRTDLMILDINLPVRDGDAPARDGGLKLLRQLTRNPPGIRIPTCILGLSEFDELVTEFRQEFSNESWQLIKYSDETVEWEQIVSNRVVYALQSKLEPGGDEGYHTDICIVTALKPIELEAVLQLPATWAQEKAEGDDTFYYRGAFVNSKKRLSVIAAAAHQMGMASCACLSMKMISQYRPRVLAMVGITAGVDVGFGDVVFVDESWDYGSGKYKQLKKSASVFAAAPSYFAVDAEFKEKAEHFIQTRQDTIDAIQRRWGGNPVNHKLRVHVGPGASGAAVVESSEIVNKIISQNRKVRGIEMEAYALFLAARTCSWPRPKALCAKGACDFGKPPKTDEFQRYAAFTSAQFVMEFALAYL